MSDVIITVRGEHELRVAPERATVHLSVSLDGPERQVVVDRTLALAEPVRDSIVAREESSAVAEWTSQRLRVHADRPYNNQGTRLDPVFRASVEFTATFADLSEMSLWSTDVSGWEGVEISHIDWHLTTQTESEAEKEVAAQAVAVAVARARAYAQALGLHHVTAQEIADRGLISAGHSPTPMRGAASVRGVAFEMDDSPTMEFRGEHITVSATVEARFAAH